jgi:hypothetical protein
MAPSSEISRAARAAYQVGFGTGTHVAVLAIVLALAVVGGLMLHAIITKPATVTSTRDGWKCQVATNPRVALCRIPEE